MRDRCLLACAAALLLVGLLGRPAAAAEVNSCLSLESPGAAATLELPLSPPAPIFLGDCIQGCIDNHNTCYANCGGNPTCEGNCDNKFQRCLSHCPP